MSHHADHLAVLLDAVGGERLAADERAAIETVAVRCDADTVRALAGLLSRSRLLSWFERNLVGLRDDALALFESFGEDYDRGRADATRLALSSLHTWTDGAHGQPLVDQPVARRGGEVL